MFINSLSAIFFCIYLASAQDNCVCVPFYQCTTNDTINTEGVGIVDIRFKQDECPSYLEVCCRLENTVTPNTKPPRAPAKAVACGYRNPEGVGYKITGGDDNEAQFGELPWMVAIFHKDINEKKHFYKCSGSLIHPQVVLTAAHCINTKSKRYKIRAGEWDRSTTNEIFKHQDRDVSSLVIHPQFSTNNLQYDVGLLFLATPIDLTEHINVACLPPPNSVVTSSRCLVSGWGKDLVNLPNMYQIILKRIELPVVAYEQCQSAFKQTRLGKGFRLHPSFMCAGGEKGKDACKGDGGGPLVCPIPGERERYHQAGIVSWGIGCGTKEVPGAYVNVAFVRNWIDEQVKEKSLDISFYQY